MRLYALLFLLFLPIMAGTAQDDIHRCMGADGQPVFTDGTCSEMNAKPVLPPVSSATVSAPPSRTVPSPAPVLCATDMAHLKQAVVDAFAVHNPNRLVGLMLWGGAGQQAAVADIRAFAELMAHPRVNVDTDKGESVDDNASAHGGVLVVQTEANDGRGGTQQTRFDVIRHDGCLWLRPQD